MRIPKPEDIGALQELRAKARQVAEVVAERIVAEMARVQPDAGGHFDIVVAGREAMDDWVNTVLVGLFQPDWRLARSGTVIITGDNDAKIKGTRFDLAPVAVGD